MAKFKFRLDSILRLRGNQRDERRAELVKALHAEDVLRQHIDELEQELAEIRKLRTVRAGAIDIDRLMDANRYELVLKANRKLLDDQIAAVVVETRRRQAELVAADRELKVLEKLRETQLQRHQQETQRIEMKALDEIAGRRHLREERL